MNVKEAQRVIEIGLDRIESMDPNKKPEFGVMTASDMVRHLMGSIELTFYTKEIELEIPEDKVGKAKAFVESPMMIRPGATQPAFYQDLSPPANQQDFSVLVKKFKARYADMKQALDRVSDDWTHGHPKFGILNKTQWWIFQGKHFYHHMSQFGLFPRLEKWEGIPD